MAHTNPSGKSIRFRHVRVKRNLHDLPAPPASGPRTARAEPGGARAASTIAAIRDFSHFETGTRQPSFDNLRRLADALAVSIDFLLGRSESIGGLALTTDVLYRNIEQLSAHDRDVVKTIAKELATRNKKGDGGRAGT